MTAPTTHIYWDSCIFIAFLNNERSAYGYYIDHIEQFLQESRAGHLRVYCSTVTIVEITEDRMKASAFRNFTEFLSDFSGSVVPISPDPIIMALAARLRSLSFEKSGGSRKLDTPDAIQLASALTLIKDRKTPISSFHTFDNGKKRSTEGGKSVPLLSFQDWCKPCQNDPLA